MSRLAMRGAIALAFIAVLAVSGQVRAAGEVATQISIQPFEPVTIGDGDAVVSLRVAGGPVLAGEPVELSIDGVYYRRTRTDANGVATIGLPEDLTVGQHRLTAVYPGSANAYQPSSTAFVMTVIPYELTIQTVPSLPGLAFTLDGERFVAGDDGVARIAVSATGNHQLAVLSDEYDVNGARVDFARWLPDSYGTEITVNIPHVGPIQAGFDVHLPVSQVFLDPTGGTVESGRVTSFTLRSSLGNVLTYPDGSERLYKASRVVRRAGGLESVDVRYNVTEVLVDGSNVVNSGQQRFYATPNATWRISLLLYSARVQAKDALFGFTAGKAVEVIFPNGTTEIVQAQPSGEVVIPWLARGIYRMTVADAPGWAPTMPVALSRDQEVELRVVSYLDVAIAGILFVGIVFGLLHRGRPHLIPGTVRAAGRGASSIGLPVPAAMRETTQTLAQSASPSEPGGGAAEPQTGARSADGTSVPVASILATIASPDATLDLKLPIATSSHRDNGRGPVSEALMHMAPGLLEPMPEQTPNANGGPTRPAVLSPGVRPVIRGAPLPAPPSLPAASRNAASPEPAASDAGRVEAQAAAVEVEPVAPAPKRKRASRAKPAGADSATALATAPKAAAKRRTAAKPKAATAKPKAAATKPRTPAKPKAATATPKAAAKPRTSAKSKAGTAKPAAAAKPKAAATKPRTPAKPKAAVKPKAATKPRGAAKPATAAGRDTTAKRPTATRRRSTGRSTAAARPKAAERPAAANTDVVSAAPAIRQAQLSGLGIRDPGQPSAEALRASKTDVAIPIQNCRNCGLDLWAGARFCRRCGEPSGETGLIGTTGSGNSRSARAAKAGEQVATPVATNAGAAPGSRRAKRGSP